MPVTSFFPPRVEEVNLVKFTSQHFFWPQVAFENSLKGESPNCWIPLVEDVKISWKCKSVAWKEGMNNNILLLIGKYENPFLLIKILIITYSHYGISRKT